MRYILSIAILVLANCTASAPIKASQGDNDTSEIAKCIRALDALKNAVPMRQLVLFGSGCADSLGFGHLESLDLDAQLKLADEHGLYCSDEAREKAKTLSLTERLPALAKICSAEYYGLRPDKSPTSAERKFWVLLAVLRSQQLQQVALS